MPHPCTNTSSFLFAFPVGKTRVSLGARQSMLCVLNDRLHRISSISSPLAAFFFFFFTVFFFLFFFFFFLFFAEKTFADCLLVAPKDAMSRNFAEKNVRKYPQNLEICENLLPLKVFPLYGILSLVSNQRNPIAVFLFFCYREKMNWLKTQTQSTHLFTWLAD